MECDKGRGLRGRDDDDESDFARPERPRRCTLPITALRVTPPSWPAIWLAESPSAHSFFRSSTRSSVQLIQISQGLRRNPSPIAGIRPAPASAPHVNATDDSRRNDMSYATKARLQ